jgi:hypothetical protein
MYSGGIRDNLFEHHSYKFPKIGCLFSLWGAAMQAGASTVATLLVGRIIGGFSIG